jgi:hypothetical protein
MGNSPLELLDAIHAERCLFSKRFLSQPRGEPVLTQAVGK